MRLYEFEGKQLLARYNIAVPQSILTEYPSEINFAGFVKAQVLTGGRGKAGGIIECNLLAETQVAAARLIGKTILGETVKKVLVETKINAQAEYYAAITYDASLKQPVLMLGLKGGVDIESENVTKIAINPIVGLRKEDIIRQVIEAGFETEQVQRVAEFCLNLYRLFSEEDLRLIEVNPFVDVDNKIIALDAMIELDDDASFRHKDRSYQERSVGRPLTERELEVKKANEIDYKGTVKYIELDGDIGFLAAGGGGSITSMDALFRHGGRPANYTEFSGNPSDEKMYLLTKAILSKPGMRGLWIVGAIANFTMMDTTMKGVIQALAEKKPEFPIVVRRSGPREKEGIALLREAGEKLGLDLEIYGKEMPLTATAKTIVEKAKKYGNTHR